jgi:hypothetical protein
MKQLMRGLLKGIIIVFVLIFPGMASPFDSAGLSMDYSIGFNGHFQLNSWMPVNVVLDNQGRAINGNLEVIVTSGSEYEGNIYRTIYKADVDLPPNSKKRYAFTIHIESFTHELIIRLIQNDTVSIDKSISLRSHYTEKNFALVADVFIAPDILPALPNDLFPTDIRPGHLPETWYGYNSVELIILRVDTIRQLRDRQFEALSHWIEQGGFLVVGTGLNYGSLNDKRLQDILPNRVDGHRQVFELKSLGEFCDHELSSIEPFLILNTRIEESTILAKENNIPIITQKTHGRGHIIFLSFDFNVPPFSRWDGRSLFWTKIMTLQPKFDRPMIKIDDQKILRSMLAGIPLKFPRFKSVVIFVGLYLILLWLMLKKIKKSSKGRWQSSFYIGVLIILFFFISNWGFNVSKSKQAFTYNSFCQLDITDPAGPAAAKYLIGLYSLATPAYTLNFGSYVYPVTPIITEHSNLKIPNPYELQQKDSGQQISGSLNRWSHSFYKLNLNLTSPLAGHARRNHSFITMVVENMALNNLVDCLVYYRKRFVFVEDILANNRQTIKLNLANLKKNEIFGEHEVNAIVRRFEGHGSGSYLRETQQVLVADLLHQIHAKYKFRPDSLILVGWMQTGLIQPKLNPSNLAGAGITIINWELPLETIL